MNVRIQNSRIDGTVAAIPSKSFAHRIAISKFLAGKDPKVDLSGFTSADITATMECLKKIKAGENILDCGESGSTLRFLIPLCAALGGKYIFKGHGKLMSRPNDQLFAALAQNGVIAETTESGIVVDGKLSAGEFRIRGDISSQYVSGLLMALPILSGRSEIVLTSALASAPYVDITLEVLEKFGIRIEKNANGYGICGNQRYEGDLAPEGDWSNAAFFAVLGAIGGKVTVTGLNAESVQGDRYITEILKSAGAQVETGRGGVTVKKGKLKSFSFDAGDCPDLVPVSAALAAFAEGTTVINNVERLKIKECDRVAAVIKTLSSFGIRAKESGNALEIEGGTPRGGTTESFNDHRMAMSAAVLAAGASGESVITGARAVDKSYPNFFEDYRAVGGKAYEF